MKKHCTVSTKDFCFSNWRGKFEMIFKSYRRVYSIKKETFWKLLICTVLIWWLILEKRLFSSPYLPVTYLNPKVFMSLWIMIAIQMWLPLLPLKAILYKVSLETILIFFRIFAFALMHWAIKRFISTRWCSWINGHEPLYWATQNLLEHKKCASLWHNQSNWDFPWRLHDIFTNHK